jgi:hypothetical protein
MLDDATTARPHTTDFIPSQSVRITQVTTKHERRLCATLPNTVGSVSKAHEPTTRGPLTTSYLATKIRHFFPRIGRATRDAATRSEAGVEMEGGFKVWRYRCL